MFSGTLSATVSIYFLRVASFLFTQTMNFSGDTGKIKFQNELYELFKLSTGFAIDALAVCIPIVNAAIKKVISAAEIK